MELARGSQPWWLWKGLSSGLQLSNRVVLGTCDSCCRVVWSRLVLSLPAAWGPDTQTHFHTTATSCMTAPRTLPTLHDDLWRRSDAADPLPQIRLISRQPSEISWPTAPRLLGFEQGLSKRPKQSEI